MSSINPFSYGKPIDDPARFIGRRREIEQVYSRLLSAFESSSIVGERRTGKTSLLKIMSHSDMQTKLGLDPQKYTFIYQDFLFLDESTVPTRFWQRVLKAMRRAVATHENIVAEIDFALKAETIDNYALDDIFTLVDEDDLYIVLLLDEFEQVTRNKNFDNDFFGGLRALAIHHNLALVTSSRQDLVQLTHSEEVRSSPFFNIFATINMRNFTEQNATELIDKYLDGTGTRFLLSELNVIFAIAGYNPYFLQMACHHLFAAHQQGLDDAARRRYLIDEARREMHPLFKDIWTSSSPSQQILLTVMALRELERKSGKNTNANSPNIALVSVVGGEDSITDLERYYARTSQVIGDLENRGLVIKNSETSAYHLFSTELCEWIADEIVGDTADLRAWHEWQKDETMVGKLALNVKDMLAQVVDGLNADYRTTLGNWLLERPTQMAALLLMQTFVSRYEQYKETRTERDAAATMAVDHAPVGDTPKGVFALVNQRLDDRQRGVFSIPTNPPEVASPEISEPQELVSTGRRIGRKENISPMGLSGLIISNIITVINLSAADQDFVNGEIKWLFGAVDNLLKFYREEIDRDQLVTIAIPPDAVRATSADNRLLKTIQVADLRVWGGQVEEWLEQIDKRLRELRWSLERETSMGMEGKSDIKLQNQIRDSRIAVASILQQVAELMYEAYAIRVTSVSQLLEQLEN